MQRTREQVATRAEELRLEYLRDAGGLGIPITSAILSDCRLRAEEDAEDGL